MKKNSMILTAVAALTFTSFSNAYACPDCGCTSKDKNNACAEKQTAENLPYTNNASPKNKYSCNDSTHQAHTQHMQEMQKELGITAEQKEKIESIQSKSILKEQNIIKEMRKLRHEIHALDYQSENYDSQINLISQKLAELEIQKIKLHATTRKELDSILTEEQRAKASLLRTQEKKNKAKHSQNENSSYPSVK
ncbi:MAG: Spy/CpxP family protein refolding chaperone [Zetaproteobacteria bacterium]|nr:Spy/CpxP family protein refolding chaperone [Zetaproteobacteria bacterium]